MFGLGAGEVVLVGVMALIFIGPKKLPEVARTIGSYLRDLQHSFQGIQAEVKDQFHSEEVSESISPEIIDSENVSEEGKED